MGRDSMAPRDRDGQRTSSGQYSEPGWDDYPVDEEVGGESYPLDDYVDSQSEWRNQSRGAKSSPSSGRRARASYPYDTKPEPQRRSTSPLPELTRNFERYPESAPTSRSGANRPAQPTPASTGDSSAESDEWIYESDWNTGEYEEEYVDGGYDSVPLRRKAGASRPRTRPRSSPRSPGITVPPAIGAAIAAQDRSVLGLLGVGIGGILIMTLVVAARIGNLPDIVPIHLDASGTPDLWGTSSTIWRVPVAVTMITVINTVTAWYISARDPFAARFLVGSAILAQVIAWIALFLLLW
jgi:hypothetical protein